MSNSWIQFCKAYAEHDRIKYSEAVKHPECRALYYAYVGKAKGDVKTGGDLKAVYNRVVKGEYDYSTSAKTLLNKLGDQTIASITIKRNPISIPKSLITMAVGEIPYDELYHLYMDIKTTAGKNMTAEKNEVIKLTQGISERGNTTETFPVAVNKKITIKELLSNARAKQGDTQFFKYSAKSANCQDFIRNCLSASGLLTSEADAFVKQRDTQKLFSNEKDSRNGVSRKGLNVVTDLAATFQTAID